MNTVEVIDICREALWVLIKVSTPLMMVALVVGLAISLFQALTQIQEMTLTFVPKMLAIFIFAIILAPYMLTTLIDYSHEIGERIVAIE